jgi:inactivated superfamily I helicase
MTQIDVEQYAFGLCRDARQIAQAPAILLAQNLSSLLDAQDELASAIQKAQAFKGGQYARP